MIALFLALQATTPPVTVPSPAVTTTLSEPRDAVWDRLVAYIVRRGAQPTMLDKESGVIALRAVAQYPRKAGSVAAIRASLPNSGLRCPTIKGKPQLVMQLISILVPPSAEPGKTVVSVTVSGSESSLEGLLTTSVRMVPCDSDGTVEKRLLDATH